MNNYELKHNKKRLLIVGYGDIGKRFLEQRLKYAYFGEKRNIFYEHFRTIVISRSGLSNLNERAVKDFKKIGVVELKLDLDDHKNIKRIAKLPNYVIVLIPTKHSTIQSIDPRMKNFCVFLKTNNTKCKGVYISTTGVYGDTKSKLIDETHHCKPKQLRSKRRLFNEKIFKNGPRFHILRVPGIYAKNRLPIERIKTNKPALVPSDDVYTSHVHAEDLARIVFISIFKGKPTRTTNAVDDSRLKMADYFDEVSKAFDLPKTPRISKVKMNKFAEEKKISSMMAGFFKESRRLKNNRLKEELKIALNYPNVVDYLKKLSNK